MLIVWGGLRSYAALRWWSLLAEYEASLGPLYLSLTGVGWVIVGGILIGSLLRGGPRTRRIVLTATLVWLIEYWLERLFFQAARPDWPFALASTTIWLGIILIILRDGSTRDYFMRKEEYEQQDANPGTQ